MGNTSKEVLVYNSRLSRYTYGPGHPLKLERLQLTMDLMDAYGLLASLESPPWVESGEAQERDVLLIHSPEYLKVLKEANQGRTPGQAWKYGLGSGDNPVFSGLYDWSLLVSGATLECCRQIRDRDCDIAFNIAGGLHHAHRQKASGFCYLNDPAVGIARLVTDGFRVAYLDVDVHHGDGVQAAFYHTNQVLTISLHQHGHTIFPGTGFPDELGEGEGRGYSVNVPLAPGTTDDVYLWAFNEVVPPLIHAFNPDVLVTQLGVDTLATDPLASLNLTIDGFCRIVQEIKSWGYKWVALGGGGYEIMNVARAWTKAWAIMKESQIPDTLPQDFVSKHGQQPGPRAAILDVSVEVPRAVAERAQELAASVVDWIKAHLFPLVGA